MWRWVFATVLVLSLGANVFLWTTRPTADARPTAAAPTVAPATRGPAGTTRSLRLPTFEPPRAAGATLDRSALEQRVLKAEARIADLRPIEERFARDPRSTETEATVKPHLDLVFNAQPGVELAYEVECHGRVCKLKSSRPQSHWMEALQNTFPEQGWFCRMSFASETYIELCKPEELGPGLARGILIAFGQDKQTEVCLANSTARGDLSLRVRFNPATHKLSSEASGSLVSDPVGLCLRKVLDEILARALIPTGLASIPDDPIEFSCHYPPAAATRSNSYSLPPDAVQCAWASTLRT